MSAVGLDGAAAVDAVEGERTSTVERLRVSYTREEFTPVRREGGQRGHLGVGKMELEVSSSVCSARIVGTLMHDWKRNRKRNHCVTIVAITANVPIRKIVLNNCY